MKNQHFRFWPLLGCSWLILGLSGPLLATLGSLLAALGVARRHGGKRDDKAQMGTQLIHRHTRRGHSRRQRGDLAMQGQYFLLRPQWPFDSHTWTWLPFELANPLHKRVCSSALHLQEIACGDRSRSAGVWPRTAVGLSCARWGAAQAERVGCAYVRVEPPVYMFILFTSSS